MTGPTTQEYQPLSQALQFHNQPPELPRLQLAPPEHQKQPQIQGQAKQQQEAREQPLQQSSISPTAQRPDELATPISSSREVSPVVEIPPATGGHKRKSISSTDATYKKRKTDQTQESTNETSVRYDGFGTQHSYAYTYPGAPPPPPPLGFHPPQAPGGSAADMSFNEFQWRLLNLCGEFYEAATELLRSTPRLVLSQAFQILDRGMGLDPIGVLNDARRTCDMLLTNPQALSTAPPPPTALPLPILTSLAHLNSRPSTTSVNATAPANAISPPSYYPSQSNSMMVESFSPKNREKERAPNNMSGTWKEEEIQKLKALAEKYKIFGRAVVAEEEEEEEDVPTVEGNGEVANSENPSKSMKKSKTSDTHEVDWDKVIEEFGDGRSRHQVLIKATLLGLKPSSSLPGKKLKKKKAASTATLPPPLTFSNISTKSIPTGHSPPQLGHTQPPPATTSMTVSPPTMAAQSRPTQTTTSSIANDPLKATTAPPLHVPPQHHHHAHVAYGQPGWYPHPQHPYYAYQPMYYSPHPQSYGIQGYGMQPPPQGYYHPQYALPPGPEVFPVERHVQVKGKRKDTRKDDASTTPASTTPIPPPSLPPKAQTADNTSSAKSAATSSASSAPKLPEAPATSTRQSAPSLSSASTAMATGSSGVLRRGANNSLFTYTPLPHASGVASTEQAKEA